MYKILIQGSVKGIESGDALLCKEHIEEILRREFMEHGVFEVFVTEELLPLERTD